MLARDQQRGVRSWLHAAETVVQSGEGIRRVWGVASRMLGPLDALRAFGAKRAAGLAQELRAAGAACVSSPCAGCRPGRGADPPRRRTPVTRVLGMRHVSSYV